MKVDLRGRHDLGEIIGYAYRIYARNFGVLFLIALTTVPLQMLAAVIEDRIDDADTAQLAGVPFQLAGIFVTIVATGAIIHAVHDITGGTPPLVSRSLDAAFERFGALVTSNLLGGFLAIASLIFLPYFAIRWTFSAQAVIIEGKQNWSALDASASIVKGQWWRTFGILLTAALIAFGPLLIASSASLLPVLPATIIISTAVALVVPFILTAQTLLYYDLKARKQSVNNADGIAVTGPDVPRESP